MKLSNISRYNPNIAISLMASQIYPLLEQLIHIEIVVKYCIWKMNTSTDYENRKPINTLWSESKMAQNQIYLSALQWFWDQIWSTPKREFNQMWIRKH